jgi:hypothetical protein
MLARMQDPETHFEYLVGRRAFLQTQGRPPVLSAEEKNHIKFLCLSSLSICPPPCRLRDATESCKSIVQFLKDLLQSAAA